MKSEGHPSNYRPVVFRDAGAGQAFLTRSTVETEKTITWEDGNEYPLYELAISMYSHPFFTGTQRLVDTEGRIEKFQKRYQRFKESAQPNKKKVKSAAPKA